MSTPSKSYEFIKRAEGMLHHAKECAAKGTSALVIGHVDNAIRALLCALNEASVEAGQKDVQNALPTIPKKLLFDLIDQEAMDGGYELRDADLRKMLKFFEAIEEAKRE